MNRSKNPSTRSSTIECRQRGASIWPLIIILFLLFIAVGFFAVVIGNSNSMNKDRGEKRETITEEYLRFKAEQAKKREREAELLRKEKELEAAAAKEADEKAEADKAVPNAPSKSTPKPDSTDN